MKPNNSILVYNGEKNIWRTYKFLDFEDFKKYLLSFLKKEGYQFVDSVFKDYIPLNKKKGFLALRKSIRLAIARIPEIGCILNKKRGIYLFFKKVSSEKLDNFIKELKKISDRKINEKLEIEMKSELVKNLPQVVNFLNYITDIPQEKIRTEIKLFLKKGGKEYPEIVEKFINEIKKMPNAIPPPIKKGDDFNKWWIKRRNWLIQLKENINTKKDKKAKQELIKAIFILIINEAREKYINSPIIFLNLIRMGHSELLKEVRKFDWRKADLEHFYFDIGFAIKDYIITIIDKLRFKELTASFPHELAIKAILKMCREK